MQDFRIETADTKERYEGLRDLWMRVFGDEPGYVDDLYRKFGEDITGYVICDGNGRVISELTCFLCGSMSGGPSDGQPVYVSYAICTDPDYRGQGLAAKLTEYVRAVVTASAGTPVSGAGDAPDARGLGGISLVSPAEESLIGYYRKLGYEEGYFVDDFIIDLAGGSGEGSVPDEEDFVDMDPEEDDFEAFDPGMSVTALSSSQYNMYRESFLKDVPHVAITPVMMEFLNSEDGGSESMYVLNGGDAVCRIAYAAGKAFLLDELLVNPMLSALSEEIGSEIAGRLAEYLDAETLAYRTPGSSRCQSMYAAGEGIQIHGYFGFPME